MMIADKFDAKDMVKLIEEARYDLVRAIQTNRSQPLRLDNQYAKIALTGPRRQLIYPELLPIYDEQTEPRPDTIRKAIMLAEYLGNIGDIQRGLTVAHWHLRDHIFNVRAGMPNTHLRAARALAYYLHDINSLEIIADLYSGQDADNIRDDVVMYKKLFDQAGINITDISTNIERLCSGELHRFDKPTVVYRLSVGLWNSIASMRRAGKEFSTKLFGIPLIVKDLGLDITVLPQFNDAGPAYAAPFDIFDPNFVCNIGYHKYNYSPHRKFINYRTFLQKWLVDYGGYSAWINMPPIQKLHGTTKLSDAIAFCDTERARVFDQMLPPPELSEQSKHLFIPLQLQTDSVETWSYLHPRDIIDMCAKYFIPRGWKIIIKKHPKDTNPEIDRLIADVSKVKGISIGTAPSPAYVKYADAIAVVNSSVGWEAVLGQKPILTFGSSEYSQVTLPVRAESDLERLELRLTDERRIDHDLLYYYFFEKRMHAGWETAGVSIRDKIALSMSTEPIDVYS